MTDMSKMEVEFIIGIITILFSVILLIFINNNDNRTQEFQRMKLLVEKGCTNEVRLLIQQK